MLDILMITHNRLEYLKKALPSILGQGNVIVWDNNSDNETKEWLSKQTGLYRLLWGERNESLADVTTKVFNFCGSEFVGKVDADMIVPPDWASRLIAKHKERHYGFLGGFHFRPEDLNGIEPIIENGVWLKHHIGGQFIIRREDFKGYKGQGVMGLTEYQAEMGLPNGYLWDPILWVEHMEDGRSPHFINNEEYRKYKIKTRGLTPEQYTASIPNPNYLRENAKIVDK